MVYWHDLHVDLIVCTLMDTNLSVMHLIWYQSVMTLFECQSNTENMVLVIILKKKSEKFYLDTRWIENNHYLIIVGVT